ncbi:hypothetical protein [Pseudoroseicyclus sp. CXY001]|uniref:hypothetical protein n=1 Tax=Pseudoroseicyclus sp. CXY001 TaxID=3242492 RepID=UPI0035714AC0
MTPDLTFLIGLVIGVLAIPPVFGAVIERRSPRLAALLLVVAAVLIFLAVRQNPGAYSLAAIPDVIVRVIGDFMN